MAEETAAGADKAMAEVTGAGAKGGMAMSTRTVNGKEDLRNGGSNGHSSDQSRSQERNDMKDTSCATGAAADESATRITDLPEALMCEVLGRLGKAADICRTATVCSSFASAVRSNLTWERLMPRGCRRLCQLNFSPPSSSLSPSSTAADPSRSSHDDSEGPEESLQYCYRRLLEGFTDGRSDNVHYRLDESTCALRMSVSVMGMEVVWGNHAEYWTKIPIKGSVFTNGMQLLKVCHFEISGSITCTLPLGRYTCAWRLARKKGRDFKFNRRAVCSVSVVGGDAKVERPVFRKRNIAPYPEWSEVVVASIKLPLAGGNYEDADVVSAVVQFRFISENPYWAQGVFVDSFVMKPGEEEEEQVEDGEEEDQEQDGEEEEQEEEHISSEDFESWVLERDEEEERLAQLQG